MGPVSTGVPAAWLLAALGLYGASRFSRARARAALGVASDDDAHRLAEMDPAAARHLARAHRLHRAGVVMLMGLPVVSVLAHLLPLR